MIDEIKDIIEEENYPYFTDDYLIEKISMMKDKDSLVKELLLKKSSIPEIKLGDLTIPSPSNHFLLLYKNYTLGLRENQTRIILRADQND